jgi:iron complex outermembrane recepter protein
MIFHTNCAIKLLLMQAKKIPLFLLLLISPVILFSQVNDSINNTMETVVIRAFEQNRKLSDVPAAVNYIGPSALQRFSPASIVMAVNATPGVTMEERSPGSYRFNIRGSSIRSPFGVRNVKVYFNDIPITDPGGHTYLNQLGYYNFNSIEIIKGPGSSLYGSGTGGVMLIESMKDEEPSSLFSEYARGSYGLQNIYGSITASGKNSSSRIGYQHQESEGYRDHSAMKRQVLNWNGRFRINENGFLKTTLLLGQLFYQTPGALTAAEFERESKAARPGGFGFPGAGESQASINQKTIIAGVSYHQQLNSLISNRTTAYGMFTELRNPTIRNYGKSSEPHGGLRTIFHFIPGRLEKNFEIDLGAEWQYGTPTVDVHRNINGNPDTLMTHDEIINQQQFIFSQLRYSLASWTLLAGASINLQKIRLQRFSPMPGARLSRSFRNEFAPRVSLSYQPGYFNFYTSIARGFSPPTTAEITPSGSNINLDLDPEDGINYDVGMKASLPGGLFIDINAFLFRLQNTIVQRRDQAGGDFFINSGRTRQAGIESYFSLPVLSRSPFNRSIAWMSHTWHRFRYVEFTRLNNDFSGNSMPGVAPHILAAGFDLQGTGGLLASITYYFSDKIPLNDLNEAYASSFHLIGFRAGFEKLLKGKSRLKLVSGVENILNEKYSLGNDVNGFGGRFFNAAPGRNYYASMIIQIL